MNIATNVSVFQKYKQKKDLLSTTTSPPSEAEDRKLLFVFKYLRFLIS